MAEGVMQLAAAYAGNRVSLSDKDDKGTQKNIANRTGKVQLFITLCFMVFVILKG
ncbi:hypothetical protein ABIB62_004225 [Mucilaginibacter sp. UYP25]|uniref:hypothetical protein n=1 Tax=unclassified Mucilaginibacter TaxID=2617802 RepID=UPI00339A6CE4